MSVVDQGADRSWTAAVTLAPHAIGRSWMAAVRQGKARFWTDAAVRVALGLPVVDQAASVSYTSVATDTRALEPGSLFVALRGARFDGHDFLGEAVERGARGVVVEDRPELAERGALPEDVVRYPVNDTLVALGHLARHYRRRLRARVCAVTGTNGKTTTKELLRAALGARFRVHATTANLNNLVGAPLTLLSAPPDSESVVVEVGTNSPGEISRLAGIVEPDVAVITGVAEGHLEGLRDLEGVLEEKTSLLREVRAGGLAVVVDEPTTLAERARALASRVAVAGWSDGADADLHIEDLRLDGDGRPRFRWAGREIHLSLLGRANACNAVLALAVAREWGVDLDAAVNAVSRLEPQAGAMRGEVLHFGELTVLADCYNANPASMDAALDLLISMPRRGGRVAVIGSMRELGSAAPALHERVARAFADADLDLIVATGDFVAAFEALADRLGGRLIGAADPLDAAAPLMERLAGRETVLLKGSRGVALERLLPRFEERFGPAGADGASPHRREG